MVDDTLWSSQQVAEYLGVNLNNLRQMQHRKAINWVKRDWREVFYNPDEIRVYHEKREARKLRRAQKPEE